MYIKQIIIQGFKSYKEQTVFEPFSPKTNVIVGRNGSGKSNFFAAIRFVLSDAYTQMGREERQALLHEGSGSAVMSAYVEIIFDNSDERFPTGKPELILRRTIGLKKDEYSLDRKAATKTDVMNLLESAGFSRSNPYYIVPQGRVTTLTNMKDPERLNLLKEVAGTQVYESRRAESLKVMTETNNKRSKIDETLIIIKDRLEELEEEKEELRGYQEKDKDRRCLEYAYYHKEQEAVTAAIEDLEQFRSEGLEGTDGNRQRFMSGERDISEVEAEIKKLTRQTDLLKLERKQLEEDRRDASKTTAKLELNVKTLKQGLSSSEQSRAQHDEELEAVKAEIDKKQKELNKITPQYTKSRTKENEIEANLATAKGDQTILFNKQGRSSQFKNRAERDKVLKKEIEDVTSKLAEQKANRLHTDEEVKSFQNDIKKLEGEIDGLRKRFDGWGGQRKVLADEVTTARDTLAKLRDERKVLRREEERLNDSIDNARKEEAKADRDLSHTMDNMTSRGLATVRRLKTEQNLQGAYGTLAELFEVDEVYRMAAEQTAGNSLFHYVVDTEATAEKLVEALYKNKGGRVTFMPLNRLTPRTVKLPNAADAQGLQSKLRYDKKFEKAMAQVFGKTVVCPSLTVAAQYARSHGCNAITPDGDTANKKGAMTGGYIDSRISRLKAVRDANKFRDEHTILLAQKDDIAKKVQKLDTAINNAMSKEVKATQTLNHFENDYDPLRGELSAKNQQLSQRREQLEKEVSTRERIDKLSSEYNATQNALEKEMASDFKKSLSAAEEAKLEQLHSAIQDLQKQQIEASEERRVLETRKRGLEIDLQDNLRLKLDQLNAQDIDTVGGSSSSSLSAAQKDLARIKKGADATVKKLQTVESQIEDRESQITELQLQKSGLVERQQELARDIEKQQKRMEKSVAKKALLATSAADVQKNIRDLGVLPEEAFEKYVNHDSKSIQKKLAKVNEALKKYKHVNKKAFEQYNQFTSQRDLLTKRRKELDVGQKSIEDLVEVLDQRKDEAIERTFKQVSKEFAQIFERLVPAGRGRLVIQRKTDQRNRGDESDDEPRENVENYTGVGISVSFNSKHDEQQRIQQLSGGQKSLCALALVFAIQQCDPAPFYLFDEIDANLDAQYRTAVAQMLEDISTQQSQAAANGGARDKDAPPAMSGQFICTTFRPEMLLVADKCYGVTFHNKTSGIEVVSREEALQFVDGEAPK